MKHIQLVTNAEVNGVLRSPVEPPIHLNDDEADRLIAARLGRDVTAEVTGRKKRPPRPKAVKAPKTAPPKKANKGAAPPPARTPAPKKEGEDA